MENIQKFVAIWEARIAAHREAKIASCVDQLIDPVNIQSPEDAAYALWLTTKLNEVLERDRQNLLDPEEVLAHLQSLYNDQSDNGTYYFNRRKMSSAQGDEITSWYNQLPEQELPMLPKVKDYGNQSRNDAFYFTRNKKKQR